MNRIRILLPTLVMLTLFLASAFSWAANVGNAVYGIYSETYAGVKCDTNNPGDIDGGYMGRWQANLAPDIIVSTEATACLRVTDWGDPYPNGGVYVQFGYHDGDASSLVPTNMSVYSGGTMNFMIRTSTEVVVKIVWRNGNGDNVGIEKYVHQDFGVALDNQWHSVSVPLSTFSDVRFSSMTLDLTAITQPVVFSTVYRFPNHAPSRTFWIDNVFWRKPTNGTLNATLRNISDDEETDRITWSNITLGGTGWKAADQYIELKLDYYHANWGIQIYTDNTAANASPRYTGTGDPAGLVDTSSTTKCLPMCWRVVDVSTGAVTIRQGAPGYPDRLWAAELSNQYPCFFWMTDRQSESFSNGDDYATVWDNRGIHHAEGNNWGGAVSTNYIYLGADFTLALTPKEYKTNRLVVELFYE